MSRKKLGSGTYQPELPAVILSSAAMVGRKEKEGPLGDYFNHWNSDEYCGEDSFEKAESYLQKEAMKYAFQEAKILEKDLDFVFAGDLLNQCIGSNYSLRDSGVQFFGLYGACSTMVEGLILSTFAIDGGFADTCAAVTSSHFCSSERQYRFPLEYGGFRPQSAQWTVTGAGCAVVSSAGEGIKIKRVCPGAIIDMNITDMANMGAAMAPAAALTLKRFFDDTKTSPEDYDLILSGDLGAIGSKLLRELLKTDKIELGENYQDSGCMIFDPKTQDVHSGGSGCGCIASVLCGYVLPQMAQGKWERVLVMGTGALMSPTSIMQGESVPGIAHLIELSR
ncbi:MAG: stage V sporulation protein AD [Clostridia bacterium]|nr:stage V sporulation protein AD [Clostridia bacterium]